MNPRLSYYGELDEMGKERTMKVGDRVRTNDGKVGTIGWIDSDCKERMGVCLDDERLNGRGLTWSVRYLAWQLECIPVEPERVRWCRYYGRCVLMTGDWCEGLGENTCGAYATLAPSSGLLQRMGMATWVERPGEWFVVEYNALERDQLRVVTYSSLKPETEVPFWLKGKPNRRAFRWQDGLR